MGRKIIYSEKFNKTYKAYRKKYFERKRYFKKLQRRVEKKGKFQVYQMREEVASKSDFYSNYREYEDMLKEEGIEKPTPSQVVKLFVDQQSYEFSHKQYKGIRKFLKERDEAPILQSDLGFPKTFTEAEFRSGNIYIDWKALREEYWYLKEELGYTPEQAREEISQYYFGSE